MSAAAAPVFLDTAIPMYARGSPHPYRDSCRWIMTEIAAGRLNVAIDAEVIQEVLHRYGALGRHADAASMAQDLMILVPRILPVTAADMQTALVLFGQYAAQGVRARDIVHVAVMQSHGLTDVISTDTHFDLIHGVTRIDPLVLYGNRAGQSP